MGIGAKLQEGRKLARGGWRQMMPGGSKLRESRGQGTIEFAVALPVLIAVAVIAVNALLFFSDCAAFDRVARQTVRVQATSPPYGQTTEESRAAVQRELENSFAQEYHQVQVAVEDGGMGHTTFTATLKFSPTLFGMGLKSEVFGVALPQLTHDCSLTVDVYKPGVLL